MVLLPEWGVKSAPFACDLSAKIDAQQRGFVFSGHYVNTADLASPVQHPNIQKPASESTTPPQTSKHQFDASYSENEKIGWALRRVVFLARRTSQQASDSAAGYTACAQAV